jgi:phage gp29-like protein
MEQNLINMGSAAYGIFQDGESLEIKETSRTDAYKVYDALIERCNSELSKLLVGQTMTSDNGSSRSQGEVHERTLEDVVSWVKIGLMMIVNSQVMPKLIQQGFPAANLRFTFDEVKDIDKLWKIVEGLLGYYDIEEQYIMDTFGIPVKKKEVLKTEPAKKKA